MGVRQQQRIEELRAEVEEMRGECKAHGIELTEARAENERLRELAGSEFSVTVRSGDYLATVDLETAERVDIALTPLNWGEVGARLRRAWQK